MFFKLIVVYRVSANSLFKLNGNEGLFISVYVTPKEIRKNRMCKVFSFF